MHDSLKAECNLVSNIIDLFNVYFDEGSTNSVLSEKVPVVFFSHF